LDDVLFRIGLSLQNVGGLMMADARSEPQSAAIAALIREARRLFERYDAETRAKGAVESASL